jgi:probable phosphoglycerate mutase
LSDPVFRHFYLIRHGETDWNVQRRFQGRTDIPLNDNGREQARILSSYFASQPIQAVLTSHLVRALETAQIIFGQTEIPMFIEPRLRECDGGDVEGMAIADIIEKFGQESLNQWYSASPDSDSFGFPGGETKGAHRERLMAALNDFARENTFEHVAVTTHGGSIRRLIHHLRPDLATLAEIPNCVVYRLVYDVRTEQWTTDARRLP